MSEVPLYGPSLGKVTADTWEVDAFVVKTIQQKLRFTGEVFVLRVNVVGHGSSPQVAGWIYNLRAEWTVNAFHLGFTKIFGGLREGDLAKPPAGREHLGGHAVQQRRQGVGVDTTLEATQGQIDGFFSRFPYKCHQKRVASMGY